MRYLIAVVLMVASLQAQMVVKRGGLASAVACTDPGSMSTTNLVAGLEADSGAQCGGCADGATFTWAGGAYWLDGLSGTNNDLKSDSGSSPVFHTSVFNGHPAISYVGASCSVFNHAVNNQAAGTYYIVFQNLATGSATDMFAGSGGTLELATGATKQAVVNKEESAPLISGTAAQDTSLHLVTVHWDGTTVTSVIDGVTDGTHTAGADAPNANMTVFGCHSSSGASYLNAKVAAIYVYTANISGATDTGNACYLKTKYGTP